MKGSDMRIALAGIMHESNSFLVTPTTLKSYEETALRRGDDIISEWKDAHHEVGGFLEGARKHGMEIVPLLVANAMPAGPLTKDTYDTLVGEIVDLIKKAKAQGIDGVYLSLHGAMVADGYPDGDGETISRVRAAVGPEMPVIVTLDIHGNVSQKMAQHATALIIYRSNPHLDQRQRGVEAADLMFRTVKGEVRPTMALETPPLVINILKQYTGQQPAKGVIDDVLEALKRPGVIAASAAEGFPYSDVEKMGMAFVAVTDNNPKLARETAQWMAKRAWDRRQELVATAPSPAEAIKRAAASAKKPIVLMDVGDNVGGGSAADSTILLAEAYRQKARNMLIILYDPGAVRSCVAAGVGGEVSMKVGGKTDKLHGEPVPIRGCVVTLTDGKFIEEQVRHGGARFNDQGLTAVVETPEEHTIILTSLRMAPMSLEQVYSAGVKPERKQIIVAKGVVAPRAAYEPIASEIILVNTPGSTSADLSTFTYKHRRKPLFPFEKEATYAPK